MPELSAELKALPDAFVKQTCVSDKCRLTSGETSPSQSCCKAGSTSSSPQPCLAECSVLIFRKTTEKLGYDDVYLHCETDIKHKGVRKCDLLKAYGPCEHHALHHSTGEQGVRDPCTAALREDFTGRLSNEG